MTPEDWREQNRTEAELLTDRARFLDPWSGGWCSRDEYLAVIASRIAASCTLRYRGGRLLDRLLNRPVRPDTAYLMAKFNSVGRMGW